MTESHYHSQWAEGAARKVLILCLVIALALFVISGFAARSLNSETWGQEGFASPYVEASIFLAILGVIFHFTLRVGAAIIAQLETLNAQAHELEQTIARNAAEILEA